MCEKQSNVLTFPEWLSKEFGYEVYHDYICDELDRAEEFNKRRLYGDYLREVL